jgi:hypothetical protein
MMFFQKLRKAQRTRQLGLNSGQMGIYNRYLREHEGWEKHLKKSREAILAAIDAAKPKSICILGSGLLLDVPIDAILSKGINLTLVDVDHPKQIVKNIHPTPP